MEFNFFLSTFLFFLRNVLTFCVETTMIMMNLLCKLTRKGRHTIEGFVTVKDMTEKWGVTVRTMWIMCSEGKIAWGTKF